MPSTLMNAEYWRGRAQGMRTLAGGMTTQDTKGTILRTAAKYDELASRAEQGEHLRERAEEMRTIAEYATDQDAKDTRLRIALEYDELARRAERRALVHSPFASLSPGWRSDELIPSGLKEAHAKPADS